MFLSIIKDFNATYHSILTTQEIQNHDFFQITGKICIFFLVKLWSKVVYLFTFQWLRDFAYFPISLPELNEKMTILPPIGNNAPETSSLVSRAGENMFDWFLGTPSSSWSLAFLSPTWFDNLTGSNSFLTETDSFNFPLAAKIFIILGLSSFFNSFLINFPLSITNIWCLRYSISHNFKTSCISILGIVLGEIVFMLCLILPPPFIQMTLIYLESIWPYIFGLGLVIWVIFDSVNNSSSIHFFSGSSRRQITSETSISRERSQLSDPGNFWKIFQFAFLLSFTEQACCFSYFGSLNLTSTSNFLDTYIFAASSSPFFLLVSCLGFAFGSFFTLVFFNYFFTQILYLAIWLSKWPVNLFTFIFSRHTLPGDKIKQAMIFFSRSGLPIRTFGSKIQTFGNTLSTVFFPGSPEKKPGTKSFPIKGRLKLIFNFLLYPLKRIFQFLFPLGSLQQSRSSVQMARNNSVSQANSTPLFSENRGMNRFKAYFISFFNTINHWYETSSPFYASSAGVLNDKTSLRGTKEENLARVYSLSGQNKGGANRRVDSRKTFGRETLLKIDKFLLTCLITFAFTTIPYYSCDYLVNQFLGMTPKDEILNNYNLRVNYTDYSSLLGIQLPDKNSIFNTDVSLYDRAHFSYGEWPTSFESLNYQGELFWTNLRDHRRQKRTRRSTRIKFKNLKSKMATSWKAFKRNDALSLGFDPSDNVEQKLADKRSLEPFSDQKEVNVGENEFETNELLENKKIDRQENHVLASLAKEKKNKINHLWGYTAPKTDKTIFSKLFGANSSLNWPLALNSEDKQNRRENLSETIKNLSSITFKDLSSSAKPLNYSKNWKKVITEKYYQNQIYKILLSSDLKNFIKREPLTQQLTIAQEKELDFLRIKMCHYFDTLRFYFKMKEKIKPYSDPVQNSIETNMAKNSFGNKTNENKYNSDLEESKQPEKVYSSSPSGLKKANELEINLKNLPFQFKSMTSLNYHQRFKGSLKPVRELFQISLPNSISFDKSLFNEFSINQNSFFHEESAKNASYPLSSLPQSSSGEKIYHLFGSNHPFYVGWDKNLRKFILTSRFLSRPGSLNEQIQTDQKTSSLVPRKENKVREKQVQSKDLLTQIPSANSLRENKKPEKKTRASNQLNLYRTYSSWPFFKHQLTNSIERPYSVMYENYFNILNKNLKIFQNININNIDKKSLSFLYTYSLTDPKNKKLVSQLPQNIYKVAMQPTSSQDIFGPLQNTWSWPGSSIFSREYFFSPPNKEG